jgi:hypothetical protein
MVPRWIAWVVPVVLAAGVSSQADAGFISFIAQIRTNTGEFQVTNLSDDGYQLTGLNIQLGGNTEFQVPPLALGGVTDDGAPLTFSPTLAAGILNEGTSAAFSFTGFDPNDVWGFTTGFVDRQSGAVAMGADMNGALITATFSNGQVLMATFNGSPADSTSTRQSFTFLAEAEATPVVHSPEPGSIVLLLMGLASGGGVAVLRRRRLSPLESTPDLGSS